MTLPADLLAEALDGALPQTQCTRCGYPRCRAYAEALVRGDANVNQCPPGGETTIHRLAQILGVPAKPLDPAFGVHEPRRRAVIDEARCIGCRKCIDACPVDAIVGARKWMHTVITAQCTGCELCLPPCPVDCIDMVSAAATVRGQSWPEYSDQEVESWRIRTQARLERLARGLDTRRTRRTRKDTPAVKDAPTREQMRAEIRAAVERARTRRATTT
jgi:electron transport complex protein RnfB